MATMYTWNDVYRRKYYYELDHNGEMKELVAETNFSRMPGLAIFYSELVHGIPPIFRRYIANVPALHSVLVFASIMSLPISKVPVEERFLFRRVKPLKLHVFSRVVRYGYAQVRNEQELIEKMLFDRLKEFVMVDSWIERTWKPSDQDKDDYATQNKVANNINSELVEVEETGDADCQVLDKAWQAGVVHLIGESEVKVFDMISLTNVCLKLGSLMSFRTQA